MGEKGFFKHVNLYNPKCLFCQTGPRMIICGAKLLKFGSWLWWLIVCLPNESKEDFYKAWFELSICTNGSMVPGSLSQTFDMIGLAMKGSSACKIMNEVAEIGISYLSQILAPFCSPFFLCTVDYHCIFFVIIYCWPKIWGIQFFWSWGFWWSVSCQWLNIWSVAPLVQTNTE